MNSEKVKEIKKALEEQTQHKPINCINSEYVEACGMYCRHHREFVADMGIKNGQTCENCNKFTATDEVKEYADILTYINELESENERLKKENQLFVNQQIEHLKERKNVNIKDIDVCKAQKDRIAELEKENAKLIKKNNHLLDRKRDLIRVCDTCKISLKQFAESLKEVVSDLAFNIGTVGFDGYQSCSAVNPNSVIERIDETLKEFLGK